MRKARWHKNEIQNPNGNIVTELVARTSEKVASIEILKDGTAMMEKVVKAYTHGIGYWKTESFVFFDSIERAKAVGEKWLTE